MLTTNLVCPSAQGAIVHKRRRRAVTAFSTISHLNEPIHFWNRTSITNWNIWINNQNSPQKKPIIWQENHFLRKTITLVAFYGGFGAIEIKNATFA